MVSSDDAWMFPIGGSIMLVGLYVLFKYFNRIPSSPNSNRATLRPSPRGQSDAGHSLLHINVAILYQVSLIMLDRLAKLTFLIQTDLPSSHERAVTDHHSNEHCRSPRC
jgi:hypothetical protein